MNRAWKVLSMTAVLAAAIPAGAYAMGSDNGNKATELSPSQARACKLEQGENGKHHGKARMKWDNTALLNLLHMDKETLRKERKAGKSLAEIAKEKGVSRQQLIDTLTASFTSRLQQGVKEGAITQEQADRKKERLATRIDKIIDAKGEHRPHFHKNDEKKQETKKGNGA